MALNDVNSNPALLPGYQLKLHWNDSGVSESDCDGQNELGVGRGEEVFHPAALIFPRREFSRNGTHFPLRSKLLYVVHFLETKKSPEGPE